MVKYKKKQRTKTGFCQTHLLDKEKSYLNKIKLYFFLLSKLVVFYFTYLLLTHPLYHVEYVDLY
jgi:hypothetical protein